MIDGPPSCRFCGEKLTHTFADLGEMPLANAYVTQDDVAPGRDRRYRLHARLCASCLLVQVDDSVAPDAIFSDYAYGAAAKGTTFLGFCGVTSADIPCVFDRSREKQGRLLPGSHLPIFPPERIRELEPDYLLILPWNLAGEISASMAEIRRWGGRFVVAVPRLRIF